MKLKLSEIIIGERQRLDLGDLSDLSSMEDKDVGLIQPIVVHKTLQGFELVDGRRRLAKATELSWPEIEVYEKDQLTVLQKNKQELFADIGRKDRSWQEKCLAISKVHFMLEREKRGQGESWTTQQMASFTGIGKSSIRAMLNVAEGLEVVPKDEQLWTCDSYVSAYKLLSVDRPEAAARGELERRRQLLNSDTLPQSEFTINEDSPESQGQSLAQTEARPKVYIHGINKKFEDCIPDKDFGLGLSYCVLGLDVPNKAMTNIIAALRPEGYAVLWFTSPQHNLHSFINSTHIMPWRLIWNIISIPVSNWPCSENYGIGVVFAKTPPTSEHPNPSGSVISAMEEVVGQLPPAVVDYSLKVFCPPNMAVTCIGNVGLRSVIDSGHTPIWFTGDKSIYDNTNTALKAYYEENIPGIEVLYR